MTARTGRGGPSRDRSGGSSRGRPLGGAAVGGSAARPGSGNRSGGVAAGTRGGAGPAPGAGGGGSVAAAGRRWRLVRAGSDAVPPSVRRFMRRARRRRLRAAAPWAAGGALLVLAGLLAWVVYGTGLFGVRDLRVTGVELVTVTEVRQAAAVPDGTPLARVDLAAVRDRVAVLPPVAAVTVSRQWPGAILIEVEERSPVAVVPQGRRFAVVDGTGVVFRTLAERPPELPVIRVAEPGPADAATRDALAVLHALTARLRADLVEITVEGAARIRVRLRGDRTIVWGDASRSETKAQVATELLVRDGDTIDVSAPDVVTIR